MSGIFEWLSNMENTKPLALVIFFVTFVLIVGYVYSGKKRRQRFESYKYIPFQDDEPALRDDKKGKENG
jgi:cbb3-type cytochrome oxidase subunit 3